jgi:hypothetical protein
MKAIRKVVEVEVVKFSRKEWGDGKHSCPAFQAVTLTSYPVMSKDRKRVIRRNEVFTLKNRVGYMEIQEGDYLIVHPGDEIFALPPKLFRYSFKVIKEQKP